MPNSNLTSRPPIEEFNAHLSLLNRIPLTHPVRHLALAVSRGEDIPTAQPFIDALLDPSPDRWNVRAVSAWALSRTNLSVEQADAATASLLDVLENARPERFGFRLLRSLKRHAGISVAASLAGTMFVLALLSLTQRYVQDPFFEVFFILGSMMATMALPLDIIASFLFDKSRDNHARAAAARALGVMKSPESAGVLAGALADRSRVVREEAADSLHDVLPLLTPEHYGLFGAESMQNLGRILHHPEAQLVCKSLSALAIIGTSHAIPAVRRAAQSGRTMRLREAANEVLAVLEERQRHESRHDTLLRPTLSPEDPSSILMRPASSAPQPTSEILLRITGERDN